MTRLDEKGESNENKQCADELTHLGGLVLQQNYCSDFGPLSTRGAISSSNEEFTSGYIFLNFIPDPGFHLFSLKKNKYATNPINMAKTIERIL